MWPRDCTCSILVRNVTAFWPCQKKLKEVKLKSYELRALAQKNSKQPSIVKCIECAAWLLVTMVTHIYNERKQAE